jgi:hypothetical protein
VYMRGRQGRRIPPPHPCAQGAGRPPSAGPPHAGSAPDGGTSQMWYPMRRLRAAVGDGWDAVANTEREGQGSVTVARLPVP